MGLDIWFAEDIRNALLAANEASAATAAVMAEVGVGASISPSTGSGQSPSTGSGQDPSTLRQDFELSRAAQGSAQAGTASTELLAVSLRAYREGYRAALTTVALAFGIAPQAITLRHAQDKALRHAQDRSLNELGTMPAPDAALRGGSQGMIPPPLQPPESGDEP